MSRMLSIVAAVCFFGAVAGCGSSSNPGGGVVPADPVARTVYEFLDAIRTGDIEGSSSRLTPLAVQRISENDMIFAPPASESATFKVGPVQMYSADKAVVDTVWIDTDSDGVPTEEHMTWALKLTDGQWRISGMAAQMGQGQAPILMDFENPGQLLNPPRQNSTASQQPAGEVPRQASQPAQDPFR